MKIENKNKLLTIWSSINMHGQIVKVHLQKTTTENIIKIGSTEMHPIWMVKNKKNEKKSQEQNIWVGLALDKYIC